MVSMPIISSLAGKITDLYGMSIEMNLVLGTLCSKQRICSMILQICLPPTKDQHDLLTYLDVPGT